MKLAHLSLWIIRWNRSNEWTYEDLREPSRSGKYDRADNEPDIDVAEYERRKGVDEETDHSYKRRCLDDDGNIKFMRKKRKYNVNAQLGEIVDQNQEPEQRKRNAVQLVEGYKKNGRYVCYYRH